MKHLTFDEISELAERSAPDGANGQHLAACESCRRTYERVRALVAAAHSLPRAIEPDADLWPVLRAQIRDARARPRSVWMRPWLAVAAVAAVLLVAATALVLSTRGRDDARVRGTQTASAAATTAAPVLQAVDRNYAPTIADLRASLSAQRGHLSPSTVRTVERALTVIDSAIAEARSALAHDPANAALIDILSAHYERKVDLLQRATELSSL